jgi:pentapeptide MXKDX repeat protein
VKVTFHSGLATTGLVTTDEMTTGHVATDEMATGHVTTDEMTTDVMTTDVMTTGHAMTGLSVIKLNSSSLTLLPSVCPVPMLLSPWPVL